jgi:hypothetical protein
MTTTHTENIAISLDLPIYKLLCKFAKADGLTIEAWIEKAARERYAKHPAAKAADRIRIIYPPAMKRFITELCEACGTTFEDYDEGQRGMLEKEVAETFGNLPCPGLLDHVVMTCGRDAAESPKVREIIERHRGKFSLAEQ